MTREKEKEQKLCENERESTWSETRLTAIPAKGTKNRGREESTKCGERSENPEPGFQPERARGGSMWGKKKKPSNCQ